MKRIFVDTGPLVALFDHRDRYHSQVLHFIEKWTGELISTWPVITEVSHLLDFSAHAQIDFLTWIHRGALTLGEVDDHDIEEILNLMRQYEDRPMDLADASLVVLARRLNIRDILTLDSDFSIYRIPGKHGRFQSFCNVLSIA